MLFTISLTEYKMLHPDTAEFPTLSQNGMLAALLKKRARKAAILAYRQANRRARRQAVCAWFGRWWRRLPETASPQAAPLFAAVGARNA